MNKKQSEQNTGSALPPRSPNTRISPHASQIFSKSGTPHRVIDQYAICYQVEVRRKNRRKVIFLKLKAQPVQKLGLLILKP